jgi:hypothetical protein
MKIINFKKDTLHLGQILEKRTFICDSFYGEQSQISTSSKSFISRHIILNYLFSK